MARLTARLGVTRYEADQYYQKALEAFKKKKHDEAIHLIDDAIRLAPDNSEYYAARGFIRLDDDQDKARVQADFEAALQIFSLEMLAHYGLGQMAYERGDFQEAILHFTEAYKAKPDRPETLYYLALSYHRNQQNDVASRVMEQAVKAFPETDKRRGDAVKWQKEFDKLLVQSANPKLL